MMSMRLLHLATAAVVTVSALGTAPALAQESPAEEIDTLETELAAIEATLADAQAQKDDAIERRDDARGRIRIASRRLELLADKLAQLVSDRALPAERRNTVAIDSFVYGDPRGSSMIAEMRELSSNATLSRRGELYAAVVEGAIAELEEIDEELRTTRSEVATVQETRAEALEDRDRALEDLDVVGDSVDELKAQRDEIAARIAWLKEVAGRPRLTGLPGVNPDRSALAVKIDNVGPAWPQFGINEADIVFEEQVEGGLSRLAAVFHSTIPETVGPVRSIRTTDIALLPNLDRPLFAHSGGNAGATAALAGSSLVDVGHPRQPALYRRESGRRAPHNLIASPSELLAADDGGRPPALFTYRGPDDSEPANATKVSGVVVNFGNTGVDYRWNGSGWQRSQDERPHVDTEGVQVAPPNVVIQFVDYRPSAADASSPEAVVVGDGDVWIFSEGAVVEGRWSRDDESSVTSWVDADGEEIRLTPGRTWVALAPRGGAAYF